MRQANRKAVKQMKSNLRDARKFRERTIKHVQGLLFNGVSREIITIHLKETAQLSDNAILECINIAEVRNETQKKKWSNMGVSEKESRSDAQTHQSQHGTK